MSALEAIRQGGGAVRRVKRMWLVFCLANLAFALVAALPAAEVLVRNLGHSL